jgi:NAD(P)-dependent dehydrogenase (short-subunit alcohol dehydrogenase family)
MEQDKETFDLSGNVALVTGGASGLGRYFCESMAEFGANVAIADVDEKGAKETAELVRRFGQQSLAIRADVNNPDEVRHMADETVAKMGRIDILVNNAGINTKPAKIDEIPIEDWDRVLGVNLRGVFLCTRAVLAVMVKQRKGNIINIASILWG